MRWAAVGAWMGVIFFFSSQTGGQSSGLSNQFVDFLAPLFPADSEVLTTLVRKGAHVTEYAILGGLLTWALRGKSWWALLIGLGYAATDEFHQLFVPGRSGQVSDVLIDAIGVGVGVLVVNHYARR